MPALAEALVSARQIDAERRRREPQADPPNSNGTEATAEDR